MGIPVPFQGGAFDGAEESVDAGAAPSRYQGAVIHDLRRTVGTMVAADGAGAAIISAVLGHMSPQSAKSYLHLSAEMARGAVERGWEDGAGAS